MNWFELSVKVGADESVPVSLPTIYFCHSFLLLKFVFQVQHSFCLKLAFVFQVEHSFCLNLTFVFQVQHSFFKFNIRFV